MRALLGALAFLLLAVAFCSAGALYRVTSTDGIKTITYEVQFGGTMTHEILTGFCPQTKKFVYLGWPRALEKDKAPKVAATIWDHETGRTIELYRFPDCPDPVPAIHDMMKVCPFTGDKNLKAELILFVD